MRAHWLLLTVLWLCSWWCSGDSLGVHWVCHGCSVDVLWMYLWSSHPEVVSRLAAVVAAAISRAAVRVSVAARSMGRAVGVSRRWCGVACLACCGGWLRSVLCRDVWRSRGFGCEKVSLVCWCCECDLRAWVRPAGSCMRRVAAYLSGRQFVQHASRLARRDGEPGVALDRLRREVGRRAVQTAFHGRPR